MIIMAGHLIADIMQNDATNSLASYNVTLQKRSYRQTQPLEIRSRDHVKYI